MRRTIRIGTRGSRLALAQARWTLERLRERVSDRQIELRVIKTTGDRVQDKPPGAVGVKGLFTKELDQALLDGRVDMVVHSLKDVPTVMEQGLILGAVPAREDVRDAFVSRDGCSLVALRPGSVVGTSSLRRRAQLLALRPDLEVRDIRGNIDTRLRKLRDSNMFQGIIVAVAALRRLGLEREITEVLDVPRWLPAPGQGALAVLVRSGDSVMRSFAALLDDPPTRTAVMAERAMLSRLEGGCRVPAGAYSCVEGNTLHLYGLVGDPCGRHIIRCEETGELFEAVAIGERLADRLLREGGSRILAAIRGESEVADIHE